MRQPSRSKVDLFTVVASFSPFGNVSTRLRSKGRSIFPYFFSSPVSNQSTERDFARLRVHNRGDSDSYACIRRENVAIWRANSWGSGEIGPLLYPPIALAVSENTLLAW